MSLQIAGGGNFETLVGAMPCAALVTDRAMRILRVNAAWERLYGSPAAAVEGLDFYALDPGLRQFKGAFDKTLAGGEPMQPAPYRAEMPDGASRILKAVTAPWTDGAGEIAGLIMMTQEVTGSEAAEHSRRTEQRLKLAAELAGIYVWEVDLETRSGWATGAEDTFFHGSLGLQELIASPLSVIHPDDRAQAEALSAKALVEGRPFRAEVRLNRTDEEMWVATSTTISAGGVAAPRRWLGVMHDITQRKQAELAAEAGNQAKSAFLATVSHEIRTPLNGVLGMVHAMDAGELSPVQRERLGIIRESGETLLAILDDVLDLSKIEAGKLEIEAIAFDFSPLARAACSAFVDAARRKGLTFSLDVEAARGAYLGDPVRIRQILSNLAANALKFTHEGEVRVDAAWDGEALSLTVADTGIGIAQDKLSALFENFAQVDASTTRRYGGTGLGLAICRQLAERMGGEIRVESVEHRGSAFTVKLPLPRIGEETGAGAAVARDRSSRPPLRALPDRLRILAAEDNAVNQLVLKTLFEQVGVSPHIVDNGALALEAWAAEPWNLILMDVQMPVMDGVSAAREIRAREKAEGRPRTPILALTANAMSHQVAEYMAAGMDGHVAKPIDPAQLFGVVEALLGKAAQDAA